MIVYLARRDHLYTIESYRRTWGRALRRRIRPLAYEALPGMRALPVATYIFSDLERLDGPGLAAAASVRERLVAQGLRCLNDPARSLRRHDLLALLHAKGINRYEAFRPSSGRRAPSRFPVFVRGENDHGGTLTSWLSSQEELDAALAKHAARDDLLVVEVMDTRDAAGVFRKYSCLKIGDRVLPRHLFFSRGWVVRDSDLTDPALLAEERRYLEENPHEEVVRRIFEDARIDHGRVDYAMHEGAPQVFEINTNPSVLGFGFSPSEQQRMAVHAHFARLYAPALEAIDTPPDRSRAIDLPPLAPGVFGPPLDGRAAARLRRARDGALRSLRFLWRRIRYQILRRRYPEWA